MGFRCQVIGCKKNFQKFCFVGLADKNKEIDCEGYSVPQGFVKENVVDHNHKNILWLFFQIMLFILNKKFFAFSLYP